MPRGLLIGNDAQIADWAYKTYNFFPSQFNRAIGIVDAQGDLTGAIIFQFYNGGDVMLSYYGRNTLSQGIVRSIARVALQEFRASRLTVVTSKRNRRLLRSLQKIGFRLEGAQRRYFGDRDTTRNTGIRLVMFRERLEELAQLTTDNKKVG